MNREPYRIEIARRGPPDEIWEELVASLPPTTPLYVVARFPLDQGRRFAIVFLLWCPEAAPLRSKMLVAANKDILRRALQGVTWEVSATLTDELPQQEIAERLARITQCPADALTKLS